MLKKTITYTSPIDDQEYTEDFYFHFSEAEITEMELGTTGGMANMVQQVVAAKDNKKIIEIFKEIIMKAYGVRSPDGKRFIKNQEVREAFMQTEAYSVLFMELASDADSASAFVNAIMPKRAIKASAGAPISN